MSTAALGETFSSILGPQHKRPEILNNFARTLFGRRSFMYMKNAIITYCYSKLSHNKHKFINLLNKLLPRSG